MVTFLQASQNVARTQPDFATFCKQSAGNSRLRLASTFTKFRRAAMRNFALHRIWRLAVAVASAGAESLS
jgi:hypothetical protein